MLVEEGEGLAVEEVGGVLSRPDRDVVLLLVAVEPELLLVLPEKLGVIVVGMSLVQVAEPNVEALPVRQARRPGLAQSPLADDRRSRTRPSSRPRPR